MKVVVLGEKVAPAPRASQRGYDFQGGLVPALRFELMLLASAGGGGRKETEARAGEVLVEA